MEERDPDFLRRFRAGDPSAFAQVVKALTPRLRSMALGFFRGPFEQEEAVQEVFVHLFSQRALIDPLRAGDFDGFVGTLARRKMIDLVRLRRPELPFAEPPEEEALAPGPEQAAVQQQLRELLAQFEQRLKPGFRPFFRRVFVDGEDEASARLALGLGRLRAKYVKKVVLARLRQHRPLLDFLQRDVQGGQR